LSLRKLTILPIAVVSLLAAGSTAVAATSYHRHHVRPPVTASAGSPAAASVVADPTSPVVDPAVPPLALGAQAPVNLGVAGTFAILTKSGITDVYASTINGNVGASPITGAAIGLTCPEVATGIIYTVDAAGPLPCKVTNATLLTTAVGDEETAYTDAAGRTGPDFVDLGAGEIGGLTLTPGLYKWNTGLSISNDVTITGGADDVFIFQVAGTLTEAAAKNVILSGGVQAKNIFWQSAGAVTIGTTAHFEGVVLSKTMIAMNTGASVNGSLLAQTAVTLQQNVVTIPAALPVAPPVTATPSATLPVAPTSTATGSPTVTPTVEPTVTVPVEATTTATPTATLPAIPTATPAIQ
jgi:hypothetical protein